jgi:myosin heavy subunit
MKSFEDKHKTTAVFIKEKAKEKFKIRHSAKEVIYTITTFIDRNVDEISVSLELCMTSKAEKLISDIFAGVVVKPGNEEVKKAPGSD